MSTNTSGTSRSKPPPGFLARVPINELKSIRVAVRRGNVTTSAPPGPIERSIDDPKQLIPLVHLKKDEERRSKSIFDREDVLVNQEERFVLADANRLEPQRPPRPKSYSRSKSKSPRSRSVSTRRRSRSSSRSRSESRRSSDKDRRRVTDRRKSLNRDSDRRRSLDRDKDKRASERRKSVDKDADRDADKGKRRSIERDREKRLYKDRPYSREREERYRKRSITPLRPGEYRPSHPDLRRRSSSRGREYPRDRHRSRTRRSRSLSRDRPRKSSSPSYHHKPSTSRKPSRSPRRSTTPTHKQNRPRSPRYGESSKDQRSRSPLRPEKSYYVERKGREKSPAYKSPEKNRRSRSPSKYEKDKRRSRSLNRYPEGSRSRSSPGRYERSSGRYSRSPGRHDSYRGPPEKKSRASRSPHPPIVTFSRSHFTHRRSSRSPGYERDRAYRRSDRRSRSRSPKKHRSRSPHGNRDSEFAYYEGIPGAEYWLQGLIRPGFPVPRFHPPGFYPRMPGAPIIFPPRIPMVAPYPPFRPRLPVYNSKQRPKIAAQTHTESDGSPSAAGSAPSTSGVGANPSATANSGGEGTVVIQEMLDVDSRKNDGSERKNSEEESRDSLHEKD